jgi:hypothetical protein
MEGKIKIIIMIIIIISILQIHLRWGETEGPTS